MSKRLVVCCDGTWNTPDQRSGADLTPTNVTKIALAIALKDPSGVEQRTFYDAGVGTNRWERIRGGAFGFGLSRNVREAYRFLVQNFEPGDELYFFGFSRGAFTVRSTAGFVRNSGILRREHADRVDEAYRLYRRRKSHHPRSVEATLFRRSYSHDTRIRFIGVWDTVGSLGVPIDWRLTNLLNRRWRFHDTDLSTKVDAAFQALALDEKRRPFRPTLWKQQADAPKDQQIEQVWFTGVHSDVGGGYADHELGDIALLWMVDRARKCELAFDPKAFAQRPSGAAPPSNDDETLRWYTHVNRNPLGELHESYKGLYKLIPSFDREPGVSRGTHEYIASSAVERYKRQQACTPSGLVAYPYDSSRIVDV
jgi:uncharacterized protein (DUF2235 family)